MDNASQFKSKRRNKKSNQGARRQCTKLNKGEIQIYHPRDQGCDELTSL